MIVVTFECRQVILAVCLNHMSFLRLPAPSSVLSQRRRPWVLLAPLLLVACSTEPVLPAQPSIVELTFSGLGTAQMTASARRLSANLVRPQTLTPRSDFTKQAISESTFTYDGFRYVAATFDFEDTGSSPTNFSLVALANSSSLAGTAITGLTRYDSTAADPAIARSVKPIHAMEFDGVGIKLKPETSSFQAWRRSELPTNPTGGTLLDYGFLARSSDYFVTFAFKLPLQATRAQDPYSLTFQFAVYNDSDAGVTESLEEQGAGSGVGSRASAIGATLINRFPGSTYAGAGVRTLCFVRTAVSAALPNDQDAFLYAPISTGCVQ